ncbi:MAG: GNAT family N-acetyltransferase [Woeseia sp.]
MPVSVVLLDTRVHNRKGFNCGVERLDRYLRERAASDAKKSVSVCYVLIADDNPTAVIGYYTLSSASIQLARLPPGLQPKLPRYPDVPATLIGRLAISAAHRGNRFGEQLLLDALSRAHAARYAIGSAVVIVDAKGEAAAGFYAQYGFERLTSDPSRLYIPMGTVAKLF